MYPLYRKAYELGYTAELTKCRHCKKIVKCLGTEKHKLYGETYHDVVAYLKCENCGKDLY